MLEALKIHDFRYLYGGRLINDIGTWLLVVAVPAHVFGLTGSLLATGLTLTSKFLPTAVLGPFAGVLTDRWDRRRAMMAADLLRAASIAIALFATSRDSVWLIYVALTAESIGTVVFRPASQALTPVIVGRGHALGSANSLNSATDGVVRLVGPPAGAALLALTGFSILILADVASYLLSALAVWFISRRANPGRDPVDRTVAGVFHDLADGLLFLRRHRIASVLLPLATVFLLTNASLSAVLVPFGIEQLGGSEQVGFVVSALGAGFLLGAFVARALINRVQPRYLLAASQLATAVAFAILFRSTSLTVAMPAAVLTGMFGSTTIVTPQTALQRVVPDAMLGRAGAVLFTAEAVATLVGSLTGPALADLLGLSITALIACAVTAAGALVGAIVLPVSGDLLPATAKR